MTRIELLTSSVPTFALLNGSRYQQQQYEEEPEEAFHMVDTGKAPPRRNFRRRRFGGYRRWNNRYQNRGNKGVDQNKKGKRSNGNSRFNRRRQRWKNHLYRYVVVAALFF